MNLLSVSIATATIIAGCASCAGNTSIKQEKAEIIERKNIELDATQQRITTASNDFGLTFFRELAAADAGSIFVSPLSLSLALSMTANGAVGQTQQEMLTTLGFGDFTPAQLNEYYNKLIDGLMKVDPSTKLAIANALWLKNSFNVRKQFVQTLSENYKAQVEALDFGLKSTVDRINGWCSDNTNGKIDKIIENIDPGAVAFIMNALYFKGIWVNEFDKANTHPHQFTTATGNHQTVDMMHGEFKVGYAEDKLFQIVELPYGNGAFSMVIMLPQQGVATEKATSALSADNWDGWMQSIGQRKVDLQIPRFSLKYSRQLNDILSACGMPTPFTAKADFSGISTSEPLKISYVKQDSFIEVNETGSEAAAVTVVTVETASISPDQTVRVTVDRPFILVIREFNTGAILFMGRIDSIDR